MICPHNGQECSQFTDAFDIDRENFPLATDDFITDYQSDICAAGFLANAHAGCGSEAYHNMDQGSQIEAWDALVDAGKARTHAT